VKRATEELNWERTGVPGGPVGSPRGQPAWGGGCDRMPSSTWVVASPRYRSGFCNGTRCRPFQGPRIHIVEVSWGPQARGSTSRLRRMMQRPWIKSLKPWATARLRSNAVRWGKQMKTFLWITIVGSVLAVLAVAGAPQPLASPPSAPPAECKCSDLKALQLELRNAIKLQQAFAGQIAELRAMNRESAAMAFANFAKSASTTVTRPATDKGPKTIDYISRGDGVSPDDQGKVTGEGLCLKSDNAELALRDLDSGASCAGIAKAVHAHEDYHQNECSRLTFMVYREKHPADRAAEEAAAYGVQIAVLRAEIVKVLEHANVRIETETTSRMTMPPNPLYTALVVDNRAVVPMSSVSVSGEMIKFDGEGKQTNNATVEGHCKFTGGLPFTITLRGSIETGGLEAQIRLALMGTLPSIAMECATPQGAGHGMSIPVNVSGGNIPVMNLPLENGAEKVFDQSTGEGAKMMAQSGVRITGQSKIRIIFCEK
jgi:hypothetical protein